METKIQKIEIVDLNTIHVTVIFNEGENTLYSKIYPLGVDQDISELNVQIKKDLNAFIKIHGKQDELQNKVDTKIDLASVQLEESIK